MNNINGNYGNYDPFAQNNNGGTMYANRQMAAFTNPLSAQVRQELSKNNEAFSLLVTEDELNRAICTHRNPDAKDFTIVPEGDHLKCTICGARFRLDELTEQQVKKIVDDFENLLQAAKMFYIDCPEAVAKQYYSMIPFVRKAAKMYNISLNNYKRYMGAGQVNNTYDQYNPVASFVSTINGLGMPTGPMNMGNPNPYQQQYYGGNPNTAYSNMPAPGGNPYIANGGGYQGQSPMGNFQPMGMNPNPGVMQPPTQQPPVQNQNNNPAPQQVDGNPNVQVDTSRFDV